jgi:hypothetical protein
MRLTAMKAAFLGARVKRGDESKAIVQQVLRVAERAETRAKFARRNRRRA